MIPSFHYSFFPWLSFSRMIALVDFFQPGAVHMGVDLSGRDICVTQHGLDRTKIGPALKQVSCEGMAEAVRRDPFFDAGGAGIMVNQLPKSLAGQRLAGSGDK